MKIHVEHRLFRNLSSAFTERRMRNMKTSIPDRYAKAIEFIRSSIQTSSSTEEVLYRLVRYLRQTLQAQTVTVWYYEKDGDQQLHPAYANGLRTFYEHPIAPGKGIVGQVFSQGETAFYPYGTAKDGSQSVLCLPLKSSREILGCLLLLDKEDGSAFSEDDRELCEDIMVLAARAIDDMGLDVGITPRRETILSLRNVIKEFQNGDTVSRVLKGIDLNVYAGELLVILGESGCGKSTLLNIVGGMDSLTDGTFQFRGKDYSHAGEKLLTEYRRDQIGFIFQSYNLMPNLTALQNLQFIAELKKDSEDPQRVLELVGLKHRRDNYPAQMSGGQQQRVSIARALVKKPKLILADEPTAALDYATSIEVLNIIEQVAASGTSIMMVTHNEEITKMANRVVRMRNGRIDEVMVNRNPLKASQLVW